MNVQYTFRVTNAQNFAYFLGVFREGMLKMTNILRYFCRRAFWQIISILFRFWLRIFLDSNFHEITNEKIFLGCYKFCLVKCYIFQLFWSPVSHNIVVLRHFCTLCVLRTSFAVKFTISHGFYHMIMFLKCFFEPGKTLYFM